MEICRPHQCEYPLSTQCSPYHMWRLGKSETATIVWSDSGPRGGARPSSSGNPLSLAFVKCEDYPCDEDSDRVASEETKNQCDSFESVKFTNKWHPGEVERHDTSHHGPVASSRVDVCRMWNMLTSDTQAMGRVTSAEHKFSKLYQITQSKKKTPIPPHSWSHTRYSPDDPHYGLGRSIRLSLFELRETGDWGCGKQRGPKPPRATRR